MATVYFFNGTQSGTADGSYADPYDLTQLATQEGSATSGDIFVFKDGTYAFASSGTFTGGSGGITYKAETTRGVIFDISATEFNITNTLNTTGANSLTVDGISFQYDGSQTSHRLILQMAPSALATFNDCDFTGMDSTARTCIGDLQASVTGYALRATFNRCLVTATGAANDVTTFNYRSTPSGANHALTVNNCTIIHSSDSGGGDVFGESCTVKNTIVDGTGASSGSLIIGSGNVITESNNCYYNIGESADPANGIIVDDPLFVDSTTGDYRLRPNSPCIGAGTSS
jgi:hypothetical protein